MLKNHAPDWQTLAQSIADGEAVLVLGPDAIPLYRAKQEQDNLHNSEETTFSELVQQRILQTPDIGVAFHYERDSLFLFEDKNAKNLAQRVVRRCANDKSWLPDAQLLRQLVAIKFPVILSLTSDAYLPAAFSAYGLPYQFDYYTAKDKTTEVKLDPPKAENPIIYNVCGYAQGDDYDSVILDYHDLFELLRSILGDLNVPDILRSKLKKANRFVLLGFQLDRWYLQLLLYYINKLDGEFDNRKHNFTIMAEVGEDTREFIIEQFQLKCISPTRADFDNLFAACQQAGALRSLPDPLAGPAAEINLLVERNEYATALELLAKHSEGPDEANYVTVLKSQYHAWQMAQNNQTLDSRDLQLQLNQLRYRILTFANELP